MNQTFYIIPSPYDAQHHGVLGMKWGIRRYQPYSVVPRGSGKTGQEIGEAARYGSGSGSSTSDKKIAKKNVNTAYKEVKSTYKKVDKLDPNSEKYKEAKSRYDKAIKELGDAESILGEDFDKVLDSAVSRDALSKYMIGGIFTIPNIIKGTEARDRINEERQKKADGMMSKEDFDKEYDNIKNTAKTDEEKDTRIRDLENRYNNHSSDIKIEREKSSNGKYSWMSTTIKDEKGKSSYEVTAMDDDVSDDYFKKTAKDFLSKKDVIKNYAMEAIMEDPYIYNSWAKNLGMSKDQFKNSLDIKSVYMAGENGMVEVSVWEKDDSGSILGYHSLDMDFDLNNLKKPKYVSMNG